MNILRNITEFLKNNRMIDLNQSQWWSIDKLGDFQNRRLRKIIQYSYQYIPGYRKKFDSIKLKPGDIKTKNDLYRIPVTTRRELQNNKGFVNSIVITHTME